MTIKVLIVDPDIAFTVPIKRALEQSGDYKVNLFANGKPAIDAVKREVQDVAILDFAVDDTDIRSLIAALRTVQPGLFVLASPRTQDHANQLPSLDIQGSITKPYLARQLVPVIREAVTARNRLTKKEQERQNVPVVPEPATVPDDTFRRMTSDGAEGRPPIVPETAGAIEEPPLPEDATIRDLVSGQKSSKPPETVPEPAPQALDESTPDMAVMALGAAVDDTIGMASVHAMVGNADPKADLQLVEPPTGKEDTQPSKPIQVAVPEMLDRPSFVDKMLDDSTPPVPPPAFPPTPPTPAATEAPEPVAQLAVQLTQLTVNSTAQATILMRDGALLASAGQLPERAFSGLVDSINGAWQGAGQDDASNALIRYIHVPSIGDFMLYSVRTIENMMLSMLFPADTPLRTIRQQARQLAQALEAVPEPPPAPVPEAATTLLSRPTDLRAPEGLREAVAVTADDNAKAAKAEEIAAAAPPRIEGPYAAYAFVWLPRADTLIPETSNMLVDWLNAIAEQHSWKIDGSEIQPSYVTLQISIPGNETPVATVETLMRETASRANDQQLWADAYYIVAPGRAVTQQEISSFMEYRRDSQDAA